MKDSDRPVDPLDDATTMAAGAPGASAAPTAPAATTPADATTAPKPTIRYFGDYELQEEIARGGMGVVWKARQVSLNRWVAVKMIRSGSLASAAEVKRFRTEAEAAANLQHPNIVAIHEVGEHGGQHYFSMDHVNGPNLSAYWREQPPSPARAAQIIQTLAEAVQYAHQRGILHRDLKPQNILMDPEGRPRITDFGLAKLVHGDSSLTMTGAVMGSPSYMPPEQALGHHDRVGPASDVYALGAILYELMTGRPPFQGKTPVETMRQVTDDPVVAPSKLNPRTPADLEIICLKCLEKDPLRRYATARELAAELQRSLNGEPILARPPNPLRLGWHWLVRHPWAITGLSTVAILGLVGLAYGLWEETARLRWQLAHPQQPLPYNANDFFSLGLVIVLIVEFFFLQALPWFGFARSQARGELTRRDLENHMLEGLVLVGVGLWGGITGLRMEIWVSRFDLPVPFWGVFAFSNVWFGSALIWKCFQHYRQVRPQTAEASPVAEPIMAVIVAKPRRLGWILFAEMACFVTAYVLFAQVFHFRIPSARESTDEMVLIYSLLTVMGLGWTTLVVTAVGIIKSRGLYRMMYLPLFLLASGFALVGLFIASSANGANVSLLLIAFFLMMGLGFGWLILRLKCLEGGETPGFWIRLCSIPQPHFPRLPAYLKTPSLKAKLMETIRRIPPRRWALAAASFLVLLGLLLVVERLRGQWKLAAVKADMARRGQVTEFKQLLTTPPPHFSEYTNRFAKAAQNFTTGSLWLYGGGNRVDVAPGKAARGSQATWPLDPWLITFTNGKVRLKGNTTNTWEMMENVYAMKQAALVELRDLLREPLPASHAEYLQGSPYARVFNFVPPRTIAQCLNDVIILHLHRENLRAAEEDLVAFAGLLRLYAKDPILVATMNRVVIEEIGTGILWDAVQAKGWTEPQLARIQRAWQGEPILRDVISAIHTERLLRIKYYEFIRRGSYRQWQNLYCDLLAGYGCHPVLPPYAVEVWRQYLFHPLWSFAWADQEEALYLERSDFLTTSPQEALQRRALGDIGGNRQVARNLSPFSAWRYYLVLPEDRLQEMIHSPSSQRQMGRENLVSHLARSGSLRDFTIPNFSRAILTAARNENLRQMGVASLALKRYQMRQGRWPDQLAALVPELLTEVPVDWMDGKPLRYRLNPEGGYTLYGVGDNGHDDGGDPTKDEVWPTMVPWETAPAEP